MGGVAASFPLPMTDRPRRVLLFAALLTLVMVLAACGSSTDGSEDAGADGDAVTSTTVETATTLAGDGGFASTVQPIIESSCAGCHTTGGPGAFHMELLTAGVRRGP